MARTKSAPPPPAAPGDTARFDFEQAMTELESVVARLEQGEVPLEEALSAFERGVALTRACQQALAAAEQKVELLMTRPDGVSEAVPFDASAGEDEPG
ncbi:MAG TPA: exodeoxyribonuclease VII small subunit [Steroidobacteraceae bacterium]|nr:exodeoxyribonuclease VII small subunit [Steroidobacteraceae bacterium]